MIHKNLIAIIITVYLLGIAKTQTTTSSTTTTGTIKTADQPEEVLEPSDACQGRNKDLCVFYGCCYAEVKVSVGLSNTIIRQCKDQQYVDQTVKRDAKICDNIQSYAKTTGLYTLNTCECGANTFKKVVIAIIVVGSVCLLCCFSLCCYCCFKSKTPLEEAKSNKVVQMPRKEGEKVEDKGQADTKRQRERQREQFDSNQNPTQALKVNDHIPPPKHKTFDQNQSEQKQQEIELNKEQQIRVGKKDLKQKETFVGKPLGLHDESSDTFEESSSGVGQYSKHSNKDYKFDDSSFDATQSLQQSIESINVQPQIEKPKTQQVEDIKKQLQIKKKQMQDKMTKLKALQLFSNHIKKEQKE